MMLCYRLGVVVAFFTGFALVFAQTDYTHMTDINLCDKRPGFEPNGEYLPQPGDNLTVYINWTITDNSVRHWCLMWFHTCNYCRLHVQAVNSFHYPACSSSLYRKYNEVCLPGCSYVHLYDKNYSNQTAESYTSSSSSNSDNDISVLDFRTESSHLYVRGCSVESSDSHVFIELRITAEEKTQTFKGSSTANSKDGEFSSPFFPDEYALDVEVYKYVFQANTQDEFIIISFDDWQLSQESSIRFDNANIRGKIPGSNYRPWIISDSHRLEMIFETGYVKIPGTYKAYKGFRATYSFIHNSKRNDIAFVQTNCGWSVDDHESGTIEFNPMSNGLDYYDCIWVIKRNPNFEKVMVKVINHSTRYPNQRNLYEIRRGLTSLGTLVDSGVASTDQQESTFEEHVSDEGFYVRLKGHYYGRKDFVLVYTAFNIDSCKDLFKCDNSRCVPTAVTCNDVDNCGDNSDESDNAGCGRKVPSGESRRSSPLTIGIIIPLVVSVFLIVVICLLILFIRRCRRLSCQARRAQRLQQQNMSNGSAGRQHRRHRRRGETGNENGIPADPPPTYEDVLSNTPIGYLNLGFTDASYHPAGPIQPPSYEEAISPTTENPAISFQSGGPNDISTDSSSPETIGRSQANISTSYSSDETGASRNHRRHRHRAASVSSSDSSTDGRDLLGVAVVGQNSEGGGSNNYGERNQPNNRRSIAKPDSAEIEPPVTSSKDIALEKNTKSNKLGNRQQNDRDGVAVIRLPSEGETALSSDPDSREGSSGQWSTGSLETSPLILNPASLLPASSVQGQSAATAAQREGRAHPARSRSDCNLTDDDVSHHTLNEDQPNAPDDQTSGRRDRYSRASPSKNVPAHIRKAKGPSKGLMKHLSKSMDNISRHAEGGELDRERAALSNRQFSRSVQNLAREGGQRDADHPYAASLQRGVAHHQSQPLALHHDGTFHQDRALEQHSEHQERQFKAESLQRDRNFGNPPGDATASDMRGRNEPVARSVQAHPQARPAQPHRDQREQDSRRITGEGRGSSHFDQSRSPHRYNTRHGHEETLDGNKAELHAHGRAGDGRGSHFNQSKSPPRYNTGPGRDEAPTAQLYQPHPYSHSLDRQMGGHEKGREQSGLHTQRQAASLDRNGLQPRREPQRGHSDRPDSRKDPPPWQPARPEVPPYPSQGTRHYPSRDQMPRSPTRDQPPSSWKGAAHPPPFHPPDRNRSQRPANSLVQPSSVAENRLYDPSFTDGHSNQNRPLKTESPGRNPYAPNQNRHPAPEHPRSERPPKPARTTQPPNSLGSASGLGVHSASRNPDSTSPHHDRQRFQQGPSSGSAHERTPQIPVETNTTGNTRNPFQNVLPGSGEVSSHGTALSSSTSGRRYPQHSPPYGQQQTNKPAHTSHSVSNRASSHSPSGGVGGPAYSRNPRISQEHEAARSGSGGQSDHMSKDRLEMKLSSAAESNSPSSVAVLQESPIRILPEVQGAGNNADLPLRMGGVVEPEDDIFV